MASARLEACPGPGPSHGCCPKALHSLPGRAGKRPFWGTASPVASSAWGTGPGESLLSPPHPLLRSGQAACPVILYTTGPTRQKVDLDSQSGHTVSCPLKPSLSGQGSSESELCLAPPCKHLCVIPDTDQGHCHSVWFFVSIYSVSFIW